MKANFEDVLLVGILVGGFLLYKLGQSINSNISQSENTVTTFGQDIQTGLQALANSPVNAVKSLFGGSTTQTPDDPTGNPVSTDDGTSGIIGSGDDSFGNIDSGIDFNGFDDPVYA